MTGYRMVTSRWCLTEVRELPAWQYATPPVVTHSLSPGDSRLCASLARSSAVEAA